jgi:hypothetical protein
MGDRIAVMGETPSVTLLRRLRRRKCSATGRFEGVAVGVACALRSDGKEGVGVASMSMRSPGLEGARIGDEGGGVLALVL